MKILFLINPLSGRQAKAIAASLDAILRGMLSEKEYSIKFTASNIIEQLRTLGDDYGIIVPAGGDGTICQAVHAIINKKNRPKIGIIPLGTGNDLARSLGFYDVLKSQGIKGIVEVILKGKTQPIDVWQVNDDFIFLNYLGIGLDAKISNEFNCFRKGRWGFVARVITNRGVYSMLGLRNLFYSIPFELQIQYRDEKGDKVFLNIPKGITELIVSGIGVYAAGSLLSSRCDMSDGRFEVTVIRTKREYLRFMASRLTGKPFDTGSHEISQFQTDNLEITLEGDSFFQMDGEDLTKELNNAKKLIIRHKTKIDVIVPFTPILS